MVLAIAGLLAAIAAPRYASANARYRVKAAAQRVAADVAQARMDARARSASIKIDFDVAGCSYKISSLAGLDASASAYAVSLSASPYRIGSMNADFSGQAALTFNGYGVGSNGKVGLRASGWKALIDVSGGTGACSVTFN